jgi:putative Holliday junction resolvase
MDGSEGGSAKFSRMLAEFIKMELKLKVEFVDERLSTAAAVRQIHQAGKKVGKSKENIDMLAATLILQTYLDRT